MEVDGAYFGGYVNDNVMVTTQLLCLEDGARVRELGGTLSMGYQNSLVFRYLDTFPRPAGIPEWPELIPEPTLDDFDWRIDAGRETREALAGNLCRCTGYEGILRAICREPEP